jgi:hypothetical protein
MGSSIVGVPLGVDGLQEISLMISFTVDNSSCMWSNSTTHLWWLRVHLMDHRPVDLTFRHTDFWKRERGDSSNHSLYNSKNPPTARSWIFGVGGWGWCVTTTEETVPLNFTLTSNTWDPWFSTHRTLLGLTHLKRKWCVVWSPCIEMVFHKVVRQNSASVRSKEPWKETPDIL